jgi:hypothetical protein
VASEFVNDLISFFVSLMSFIPDEKGVFGRFKESVTRAFVPPQDPKEAVQKWSRQIRSEGRAVERSIRGVMPTDSLTQVPHQFSCIACGAQPHRSCRSANRLAEVERNKKKAEMQIKQHAKAQDIAGAKVCCSNTLAYTRPPMRTWWVHNAQAVCSMESLCASQHDMLCTR